MAAKTAKQPLRKTTKSPPKKPLSGAGPLKPPPRKGKGSTDLDEDLDFDSNLELGAELSPEDNPEDNSPLIRDTEDLPPLRPRPTRRAAHHTIFPSPDSFSMSWDKGRLYWKSLWEDPRTRPRLRVYIYRWFPSMLEGHRQVARLDGDAPPSEPERQAKPLTIQEVLHRYGTGDYGFKINDSGAGNQQICQFKLVGRSDMRDWENYPPILDMDHLDLDDPINQTYIKAMKAKKRWNSDEEKEENMAALEKVEKLYERMLKERETSSQKGDEGKAAEVVAYGAKKALDLIAEVTSRTSRGEGGDGATFIATATALAELLKSTKGDPGQTEMLVTVMQRAAEAERAAYNTQIQGLQSTVQQLMTKMDERAKSNPDKEEEDPLDRYRKVIEMKEILGDLFNSGGGGGKSREPWFAQYLPAILPAINNLSTGLTYWLQTMGAKQSGANPPSPPPTMDPSRQVGAGQPPNQVGQQGGQPGTGQPGQPPQPTQEDVSRFLEQLRQPLLRYLNDGRPGYEFADLFIEWYGQESYDRISSRPPQEILQFLSLHPPLWGDLAPRQEQVLKFLEEFVSEPPSTEGQEPEREADKDESQPTTVGEGKPNGSPSKPQDAKTPKVQVRAKTPSPGSETGAEKKTGKSAPK